MNGETFGALAITVVVTVAVVVVVIFNEWKAKR